MTYLFFFSCQIILNSEKGLKSIQNSDPKMRHDVLEMCFQVFSYFDDGLQSRIKAERYQGLEE